MLIFAIVDINFDFIILNSIVVVDTSPAVSVSGASAATGNSSTVIRRTTSAYGSHGSMTTSTSSSAGTENPLTASSSSDKLSVSGRSSSDKLNAISSASSASTSIAAGGVATSEKRVPMVSRKPSMIPPAGAANQNAKDFFSSLMSDSGKK